MPNLPFVFNTEEIPESNFEPIPAGDYKAMITESEMKATKSNTGEFIELKIELTEGEHSGRTFFERLNIVNQNEKAVEIAYQTLAKICKAVNKNNIQRTEEIHNIRFFLSVGIEESKPYQKQDGTMSQGGFRNVIKGYKSIMSNQQQPVAVTKQPSAVATPSNSGSYATQQPSSTSQEPVKKLPWKK